MMTRVLTIIVLGVFLLGGCASNEPRINEIRTQHPDWDRATVGSVASRQVEVGMTVDTVVATLGKPDAVYQEGDEEKWGYAEVKQDGWNFYQRFVQFIYFKEGKVIKTEKIGKYRPKKSDWYGHKGSH